MITLRHTPTCLLSCRRMSTLSPKHSIYISNSTNPYFNLTFEDWLFRHKSPHDPLLLIYRDKPCVVIGRNQNPWKEVNLEAVDRTGVPFIRRRSGGGTVYHDLGNTNFSIHLSRTSFDRHATARLVLRAARSLGVDAHINDRNDICVGKDKMSCKIYWHGVEDVYFHVHVSGSAYKIVNQRAYHHGTMLISTSLDTLGDLLHTNKETMITKGVASVRSPVCNLQQHSPTVSHDIFADAVIKEFQKEYNIHETAHVVNESQDIKNIQYIRNGMDELPSWQWAYGQTPEFTYTISNSFSWGHVTAEIRAKHGLIVSCSFGSQNSALMDVVHALVGKRYGFVDDNALEAADGERRDVWEWLKSRMQR